MDGFPRIEGEPENRATLPGWMYWVYLTSLVSVVLATLLALAFTGRNSRKQVAPIAAWNGGNSSHERSALATHSLSPRGSQLAQRPLFPYSIIPGGADSAQELKNAVAHDGIAASHFANFDLAKARIIRLDRDRAVYVSYRLGNRVYWTTKRVKLSRGERIITDGEHEARTRCGNRISAAPSEPVSPQEPPAEAMEAVQDPGLFARNDQALEAPLISPPALIPQPEAPPESPPEGAFVPPFFPIVGGGSPPPPVPPAVATPEPGTLGLLATGLSIYVAICVASGLVDGWRGLIRKRRKA